MLTIYHNNRCGKSRCALQLLADSGQAFETVEYLKNPPSEVELRAILDLLGKKPLELIRQKEPLFQEKFKGKTLSDAEWVSAMVENPILIERPIVVHGKKAWVARDEAALEAITAALKAG